MTPSPPAVALHSSPCTRTEQRTYELLDDALSDAEAAALHAHLGGCVACRTRAALLRRFLTAVRRQRVRQPAAPAALRRRVEHLLERAATDPAPPLASASGPHPTDRADDGMPARVLERVAERRVARGDQPARVGARGAVSARAGRRGRAGRD